MVIIVNQHFYVGVLLILAASLFISVDATLSLEQQMRQTYTQIIKELVETKEARYEEKFQRLETQNSQLKADVQYQNKIFHQLEAKNDQLEKKVSWLESKVQRLESAISVDSLNLKSAISRTCREAHLADPSLSSGMHWIDPDGQGVGDDPIYVYCDMTTDTTSILHDSEGPMDVGHCPDPGCYSKSVSYNASLRQMAALADLSNECHQSIQYDCYYAPFELNDVVYSWWNDINGNAKYFWAGTDTDVHTCQCGIDGNCVESFMKCNCDSAAPEQLVDSGSILIRKSCLLHVSISVAHNSHIHPVSTHWADSNVLGKWPSLECQRHAQIFGESDTL